MKSVRAKYSHALLLCLAAVFGLAQNSFAACTLGTNACCIAGGGALDNSATRRTWQPNSNTTIWTDTNNWATANVPDAAGEEAYIQSDWRLPDYPQNNYTLSCLQIASGAFTAIPTDTVTMALEVTTTGITATATNDRFTFGANHNLTVNDGFVFTAGTLPAATPALALNTVYYVRAVPAATTITLSPTVGGTVINVTANGTGLSGYSPGKVTWTAHGLAANDPVVFYTTNALLTGITAGTTYYVAPAPALSANLFYISAAPGGLPLPFSGTQAGTHTSPSGKTGYTLTITGEYFKNTNPGSLTSASTFSLAMAGTYAQTLDNVDNLHNLTINNATTVTLPSAFSVLTSFTITSGTGTVKIGEGLNIAYSGSAITIPASATLEVQSGAVLTAMGGITVNGILKVNAGGRVLIGNGKTLQVNAGGLLQMIGTSGNVASLDADQGGSSFTLNVAGSINANYFSISRTTTNGLNITTAGSDTIQTLSNGDFHYIASAGRGITLNTAKNLPNPDPSGLGFFDDFSYGNIKNIHANSYTGSAVTIDGWAGLGGATYEVDTGNKITWGTQAARALQITNRSASGAPLTTIAKAASDTFATYGFGLNSTSTVTMTIASPAAITWTAHGLAVDTPVVFSTTGALPTGIVAGTTYYVKTVVDANTINLSSTVGGAAINSSGSQSGTHTASAATDITSVTLTLSGNNVASDVNYIQVYDDTNSNCVYNGGGTDVQIGSNLTMTGSPPTATVTIPAATVRATGLSQKCIHVRLTTNANAQTDDTLQISVVGTSDVTNSTGYSFASNSGPPVSGTVSTITGSAIKRWNGGNGTANTARNWNALAGDWTPSGAPATTDDCQVGPAYSYLNLNASYTCTNLNLPASGHLIWGAPGPYTLSVLGALTIGSSYVFTATSTPIISMASTVATQSITASTTYPGNLIINNTFGTDGLVTVDSNLTVSGNLTITHGVLRVTTGHTLTVGGSITVNAGTLDIDPGATLSLANGQTLTVNTGATFNIVGDATQSANFTCGAGASGCTVSIAGTGTIAARYYSFNRLGLTGLTIASGANIDGSNYLQDGSFTYPVVNNAVQLVLNRQIPGNALSNMTFDKAGSTVTGAHSIDTSTSAGTLTISAYSGDLTNCSPHSNCNADTPYVVNWVAPTTTLKLTLESSAPTTVNQGDTLVTIGRFGFQQTAAGPYADTDITSLKVTMDGTQNSSDVSALRLFYDSACAGTGGVQVGSTSTFSGSPPTATFSGLTGATVHASVTSPPKRCFYVQFDIASAATVGDTLGVSIQSNADVVNSQAYSFNGSYSPPLSAGTSLVNGTTITWTGNTNTDWATPANWNLARIPTTADNCIINNVANDPVIGAAGAICKSLTIGNGILTINTSQTLSLYGSLTNTGTLTLTGTATLTIRDDGVTTTNQTLQSSSALSNLVFNKTAGGYVYIGNQTLTINALSIPAAQTFTFNVRNGDTLTLPTGATITSGTFQVDDAALVKLSTGQTFLVNGGTLYANGVNDGYPQSASNKAKFTINGSGTWGFNSTSGTLNLTGFLFDYLDTSGLRVAGTTILSNFNGGQFTNLSNTYASVRAVQINTSGAIPATADYVGFNWGANNTRPAVTDAYTLGYSSGCASHSMTFTNWWGDFFYGVNIPVAQSKINTTSCTLTMTAAASAVTLTELSATPYDSKVVIDWTTGLESLHQGFNIYRSTAPEAGFVQINPLLIRNPLATGSIHGHYQFYDGSVTNGVTYYYKLEDIAANGKRSLHGPLEATPDASLGAAPAAAGDAIIGGDQMPAPVPSTPDPADLVGTGVAIAPGVTLLAKTNHSMRIRIDVPAILRTPSVLPPYEEISIPGYSSATEASFPELPERVILVEIPAAASAAFSEVRRTASVVTPIDVVPARAWTVVSGSLVPSAPVVSSAFYSTDQSLPSVPIELGEVVQNQGLSYLPIKVKPLSYNPVQRTADVLSQIVIDVTLSGAPEWNAGAPQAESGPWGYEGALKIHLKKAGLYQLRFSDLVNLGIEGPFDEVDASKLRLFSNGGEIPLQVESFTGFFSDGDSIRFFAPYFDNATSDRNTLVLIADSVAGKRMDSISGAPNATASTQASFNRRLEFKTSAYGLFQEPYGEGLDHIFWGGFYAPPMNPGEESITASVTLPNMAASGTVNVKAHVKGSPGAHLKNPDHHVRLYVNGSSTPQGDITFKSNEAQVLVFSVPAAFFLAGLNSLTLEAMGDLTPGDFDFVNLEKIVVDYPHTWRADSGVADITNYQAGSTLTVQGLPSEPFQVYDITRTSQTAVLTGVGLVDRGVDGYEAAFSSTAGDPSLGRRFTVVSDSAVLSPWSLELNPGSNLLSTSQGADAIYIGPRSLLDAVAPLAALRESQGFRVKRVAVEDIYMEFGQGMRTAEAVKAFVAFANSSWEAPAPKYVILVGDGTFDPKNQLGHGSFPSVPIHLSRGHYLDYANDNWFVTLGDTPDVPTLAVGRIPGRSVAAIGTYVAKVLAYESDAARPTGSAAAKLTLISDSDQTGGEHFDQRSADLAQQVTGWNSSLHVTRLSRDKLGDAATKQGILQAFSSGSAIIHYMGHGAEDRWADSTIFMNADADALTNTKLPFVVAMNCLNGYFYDPQATYQSLADRLLFNRKGGAIAVWASTSLTPPDLQTPFQLALYNVIADNPGIRLGDAVRIAKISGGINTGTAEVVGSWTLLGDPMVQMKIPARPEVTSGVTLPANDAAAESTPEAGSSCMAVHRPGATRPGLGTLIPVLFTLFAFLAGRIYRRRLLFKLRTKVR